jgi:helix-turn-helix protein
MEGLATSAEVARYLNVRPNTLDRWSSEGRGPRFVRVNGRRRYDWEDVKAWTYQSPSKDRPNWRCSRCGEPATTDARLITSIDLATAGEADWGVLHYACQGPATPNPYEIDVESADTWQKLADWVAHLWEKDWAHNTDLAGLIRKAGAR